MRGGGRGIRCEDDDDGSFSSSFSCAVAQGV